MTGSGSNEFHFVASTGRTATTYVAAVIDSVPGVAACHEGYRGADKDSEPLLPLINLENRLAYNSASAALDVVRSKRSEQVILESARRAGCIKIVDVAYYNSTLAQALLATRATSRMVGLIRNCESFVRSATILSGEDRLPVGWPDPAKPLTARERFIQLGRLKPRPDSPESAEWKNWSAVMRNIWLWRETNLLLCQAKMEFPDRVVLLRFEEISEDPAAFWKEVFDFLAIEDQDDLPLERASQFRNARPGGYQLPASTQWDECEQEFLRDCAEEVAVRMAMAGIGPA